MQGCKQDPILWFIRLEKEPTLKLIYDSNQNMFQIQDIIEFKTETIEVLTEDRDPNEFTRVF